MSCELVRNSCTWYKSFEECIADLDEQEGYKLYRAISRYSLYGEEPSFKLEDLSVGARIAWRVISPILQAARAKSCGGSKGGKAKKNNNPMGKNQHSDKSRNKHEDKHEDKHGISKIKDKGKDKIKDKSEYSTYSLGDLSTLSTTPFPTKKVGCQETVDDEVWLDQVREFGEKQGISREKCDAFFNYVYDVNLNYVTRKNPAVYEMLDGTPISNWKGAFIQHAKKSYNRDEWEKEHNCYEESRAAKRAYAMAKYGQQQTHSQRIDERRSPK